MARVILLSLSFVAVLFSSVASASQIRVAVAANFKPVLDELADRFEKKHGTRVLVSSASSGILYNQINHGAPFDLFLSADEERPQRLVNDGLAVADSHEPYAYGRLVLWQPKGHAPDVNTLKTSNHRLAIANPALAPYGMAAQQTLEQLNLWQGYQGRLVQGASIQQAWQFVASGNVGLGLVAKAQVLDQPAETLFELPTAYYEPIRQDMVILKRGNQALAESFRQFVLSDTSQNYIKSQGYFPAQGCHPAKPI